MHRQHGVRRAIGVGLSLVLVLGACSGGGVDKADRPPATGTDDGPFVVKLSAGKPIGFTEDPTPVVDGDALDDGTVAGIVDRLPPFAGSDDDRTSFNRPPQTLPRPRVGTTIDRPFGASGDARPPAVADGPLEVVRHQPEGDVDVAPFVSVTFNQPMVALGTLEQLDRADVPVRVKPALDGRWRWIGARTLRFEHDADAIDRLPMATEYTVEIPAGTRSQSGATLDEPVTWTFRTPPPQVLSFQPESESIDTDPVFLATFDQRVDPAAVLATITVKAGGDRRPVRLATTDEIADDDAARQRTEETLDGRWVAFRAATPLPTDTDITVDIGPGTPSAEGPRVTKKASTHRSHTFAALKVTGNECGYGEGCRPDSQFSITFNNQLDVEAFDSDSVEVSPDLGASVGAFGNTLVVQGSTRANTTYEVRLPPSLRDEFGQTLGDAETVRFEVGAAAPALVAFPKPLVTTDPMAETPTVSVTSIGHRTLDVDLYAVDPSDFAAYDDFIGNWDYERLDRLPEWQRVSSTTVDVAGDPDQLTETTIDLEDALGGHPGHLVVVVSPTRSFPRDSNDYWNNRPTLAWVQVTSIGVDALADRDHVVAWATDLRDGSPINGATVRLGGAGTAATTDGDGLASLPLGKARFLVATLGDDSALLAADSSGTWDTYSVTDVVRWYVFDDRQLYRPGEQARVKGWVRRLTLTGDARITPLGGNPTVRYVVHDSFGNELATGSTDLNRTGGFDLAVEVPLGAALGPASLELTLEGADGLSATSFGHQFQIQEFRRPEFEVVTQAESPSPHMLTGAVTVAAVASYFAGGTLSDSPVTWRVTTQPTTYSPPNWSDFTFGIWKPWWFEDIAGRGDAGESFGPVGDIGIGPCCEPPEQEVTTYEGRTDTTGTDYLQLDFEGQKPDEPITVSANAAVDDVNRQSFASTIDLLVHPASLYVGLRSARTFVRQGDPLEIEAIVTDIDGQAVADREITVTAARVVQKFAKGTWTDVEVDAQDCTVTSADKQVSCSFDTDTGGQYKISSTVTDDDGGRNRSELTRWVSGGDAVPTRDVEQELVTIVPDRATYHAGDTAELLVISPFSPAHGLLTIGRNGIESTRAFELTDGSTVLKLPLTEALVPGIDVQIDLVGTAPRQRDDGTTDDDLPPRPAFATGTLTLPVPPRSKVLKVTAEPKDSAVEPGGRTSVAVTVADAAGRPLDGAEVAVVVVDEAVLSLVGYDLPDPIAAFYQPLVNEMGADYGRRTLLLANAAVFGGGGAAAVTSTTVAEEQGDAAASGGSPGGNAAFDRDAASTNTEPIDVRSNFDALAVFAPAVRTGADGSATVDVRLPDNLTRYRVMAVAADDADRFGTAESTITARLPLMVRPSAPRFLNFGDRFELPVVVQNQTDESLDVDVVVQTANLSLTGPAGKRVRVPANERVEVRFPATADDAGTARYRVAAVSGDMADSATGELPVYTPVTTEAFATYGVIDDGAVAQPLLTPTGVVPQFGGLEIDTSSTALQALTDAVVYLTDYPYESADAYASRIIALVSLRDVFAAFAAEGVPTPQRLDDTIRSDITSLVALQNDDGGFANWQRGQPSQPYDTVQATHALVAAKAAGYPVADDAHQRALDAIRNIEKLFGPDWDEQARHAVSAYALYVRNLDGDRDSGKAEALYRADDALPLDALAWLWPVVADGGIDAAIERTLANRVTETAGAATFTTGYDEGAHLVLASDRRTDGIILDALITRRPASDLIPKVVNGLIGNQVKGRWSNVQENGFILLALEHYFDTFEAQTPSFVARAWLGDTYAAEHTYEGRSIDRQQTLVPMTELAGDPDIVLAKDGPGRLYYRLGLRYAPADLTVASRDEGFVVDRTYEAVDEPGDVRRDADGTWHIKAGASVRVRLTMVADSNRTNMVLVDPLPAGLEIVNPALAASPQPPADDQRGPSTWFGWTWFDHQSLRDDRAEAYSAYLYAGTYEYSYVARATTPGTFVTPPTKAEEIYAPEVFGRSATDTVVVGS